MIENMELAFEININDSIRSLKLKQMKDLKYLNNLMIENRIAPSLV